MGQVYEAADVEKSLRDLLKAGLYGANSTVSSSTYANTTINSQTYTLKVARGWPNSADLQKQVANASCTAVVTIYAPPISSTARCSLGRTFDVSQAPDGGDWTTITELSRTQQRFRLSVWASDGPTRDALVGAIRGVIDPLAFVPMPFGYSAEAPVLKGTPSYPTDQSAGMYRRDVDYDIIYPTYQVDAVPSIQQVDLTINSSNDGASISETI